MANSLKLASQVLNYIKSNTHGVFREFNTPQLAAIEAALTRRITMIQGELLGARWLYRNPRRPPT